MTEYEPTREMFLTHFEACAHVTALINKTIEFMSSPDGSGEEEVTQTALVQTIDALTSMPKEDVGNLLMALTTMILQTCDPHQAQEWLHLQAQKIQEGLDA